MRKTKKMLLLSVLLVSVFCFIGKVGALGMAWGISKGSLICDPVIMSPESTSNCYYIGEQNLDTAASDGKNAGFYLVLYTTQNLVLKDVSINSNMKNKNAAAILVDEHSGNDKGIKQNVTGLPKGAKDHFTCNVAAHQGSKPKSRNSSGCGIFYTKEIEGQTIEDAYSKDNMGAYGYLSNHEQQIATSGVTPSKMVALGTIQVELPKKNNIEGCGEICIAAFGVADQSDWGAGNCLNDSSSATGWNGQTCDKVNTTAKAETVSAITDGDFACYELSLKATTPQNTPTGAFVSYAILAAGALIAISAVTIAKKHNRLQKI